MRNFFLISVLLLCISIYAGIRYNANNGRMLRVGTECDYAPHNWEEDHPTDSNVPLANKEGFYAEGYDIQIAKVVADSIGSKLEVKKLEWDDLIPALNRREIDAIFSGMLDSSARREVIAFSDIYEVQKIEYGVLVRRDGNYSKAKKMTDFAGARFVGQEDTNLDRGIAQLPGAVRLEPVKTTTEMFDKLFNGEVDGIIIGTEKISANVKANPEIVGITFPEDEGFKFDYTGICAGVRKQDTRLQKEINDALKDLNQRERQRIMDRTIARDWNNI
ncbi:MAG: transporter substrate-binding domain-containing protein [Synergistaceae bacterium]|nr:transporter substrate-binding domain-containing protein [Synergistaceae bacterium]